MGYGYFYFENNSATTQFAVSVELRGPRGVVYATPYEGDKKPMVTVAPGSFEVLYWYNPDRYTSFLDYLFVTTFTGEDGKVEGQDGGEAEGQDGGEVEEIDDGEGDGQD